MITGRLVLSINQRFDNINFPRFGIEDLQLWETHWLKVRRIQLYVSHIHKKKIRIQPNKVSAAPEKMNSA
jgi:hypothetical protein